MPDEHPDDPAPADGPALPDDTARSADAAPAGGVDAPATPVVAVLRTLADERATGTVHVRPGGGWISVREGRVVLAGSPRSPTFEEVLTGSAQSGEPAGISAFTRRRICRETTCDAALVVLADDSGDVAFRRAEIPPRAPEAPSVALADFLAECERRAALLRRIGDVLTPEDILTRAPSGKWEKRRISITQWRLIAEVDEETPAARIAARIGHGVTATTVLAHSLIRLGLLSPPRRPPSDGRAAVFLAAAGG